MAKTKERFTQAQARKEKNHDARLRNQAEIINIEEYVYLHVEMKDPNEHRD